MSREQLNAATQHFFQRILPAATGKRLTELQNAEVLLGAYRRHTGGPVQSFGRSVTPQYILKVGRTALPIQNGSVSLGAAPVGADAADHSLIWLRFVADAKVDDQATIRDLMGDLDTYAQRRFSVAGVEVDLGADAPVPPNSEQWSQAIQNNRAAMPDNLNTLTEVPQGLRSVASSVEACRRSWDTFSPTPKTARTIRAGPAPADRYPAGPQRAIPATQRARAAAAAGAVVPLHADAEASVHHHRSRAARL